MSDDGGTTGSAARGEAIFLPEGWHSGSAYTPGLRRGPFLFVSGQVPVDRTTGDIVGTDIVAQTDQVIDNIEAVLRAGGATLDDVVKVNVFLTDVTMAPGMNAAYRRRFTEPFPARSTVQVGPLAKAGYLLEAEATAYLA